MLGLEEDQNDVNSICQEEAKGYPYVNLVDVEHDSKQVRHHKKVEDQITSEEDWCHLDLLVWLIYCLIDEASLNDNGRDEEGRNIIVWGRHNKVTQRWTILYLKDKKADKTSGMGAYGFRINEPFGKLDVHLDLE